MYSSSTGENYTMQQIISIQTSANLIC